MSVRAPTFYAWLSLGTSIVTIVLKFLAYWLTGSVGLLSDAVEAVVNIVAALVAAHGGTVGLDTTPGGGATFRITLPLAAEAT